MSFDLIRFDYTHKKKVKKLLAIMPHNGHDGCIAECYVVCADGSAGDWAGIDFEHELWMHVNGLRKSSVKPSESPFEVTCFEVNISGTRGKKGIRSAVRRPSRTRSGHVHRHML